jgi:WD40 repeat protein
MSGTTTCGDLLVDFSPGGKILATTGHSWAVVKLWNTSTGKETSQVRTLGGIIHSVRFFPDGKRLLAGTQSGCWLLDVRNGAIFNVIHTPKDGSRADPVKAGECLR